MRPIDRKEPQLSSTAPNDTKRPLPKGDNFTPLAKDDKRLVNLEFDVSPRSQAQMQKILAAEQRRQEIAQKIRASRAVPSQQATAGSDAEPVGQRPGAAMGQRPGPATPSGAGHDQRVHGEHSRAVQPDEPQEAQHLSVIEEIAVDLPSEADKPVADNAQEEANIRFLGGVSTEAATALFSQEKPKMQARDPAPSKASYRWQRLWLRPVFRAVMRTGIPVFGMLGIGLYLLSHEGLRTEIEAKLAQAQENFHERPEFRVDLMQISGASPKLATEIRKKANLSFPVSTFDLDLKALHKEIVAIDAIESAQLQITATGVLEMQIQERVPAFLWRNEKGLFLLDQNGQIAGQASSRMEHKDLVVVLGQNANNHIQEAEALLQVAAPLSKRVRGLMRIGDRRWDLYLDRGQMIKLPEQEPVAALEHVLALQSAQRLLDRNISVVDFRDVSRPILRIKEAGKTKLTDVTTSEENRL